MEPITAGDLVELATDVGPVPMNVAVVLDLAPVPGGVEVLAAEVGRRLAGVPRLRRRLVTRTWGRRPCWVDDGDFDVARHVSIAAGDPAALDPVLEAAADVVTTPLPRDRPLWRAVVVTGAPDGGVGVVVVMHHVVADGIGGLALLAEIADRTAEPAARAAGDAPAQAERPRAPAPDRSSDPGSGQATTRRALPAALTALRHARVELGGGRLAPRCSLNAPTGPRRAFARVEVDLDPIRRAARRHGATVNDALLVAVTGAMARLLTHRGDVPPAELVVSVPVSARPATTSTDLGNRVGVMPVRVPLDGPPASRLARVARQTQARKAGTRGASAAVVGPLFRALAAVGVFRRFVDRQRLVNSFLTNLRGPATTLHLAGAPIRRMVPLTITAGNVGVAFAAFSYDGTLGVTLIADPGVVPDTQTLASALETELLDLTSG
ncbi:MAG TPA: wax ester/triacylglycerol synthase domain-containing protein [Actinotalea sp.]|nr:wax ester/triacylglycerol synthase domain-containing protein [Actinotalea sp.]